MIAALYNKHFYLRVATGVLLILLIALKTAAPVFIGIKPIDKEVSSTTENGNDGEKKAEPNPSIEKEKEFTGIGTTDTAHLFWYTRVLHLTGYQNNYQTTHFLKVASPPPDSYLQSIC